MIELFNEDCITGELEMYIDDIGYIREPARTYEELRDNIEELIDDYIAANNPANMTVCASLIMRECGVHAMQVANLLGGHDEIVFGVRDAFIEEAQQEDIYGMAARKIDK